MTAKIAIVDKPIKADITDVADWFLLKGNMSNKKIQKLCYYAQAWSLTLLDQDIASHSEFEALLIVKKLWLEWKNCSLQSRLKY